ncbi:hypothetical protein ACFFV7_34720 [Nonomuraea spiralis]|uniref:DoxX family membrane protein n=1 Tax=Nonomuraea spiralis TaxID=46182 RepID=A0ABV5IPB4_9ACTN|nr:hypothetical protein [Nonomuraea spiralis]GGT15042.1 hypothetical protein GCM10010176_069610 [Nonomuraea spiralis]
MTVIVLLVATLGFRLLGALGVRRFATWRVSAAHGLAVMLVMTGSAHFVPEGVTLMPNHGDLVRMVPPFVPFPAAVVYLTGVFELAGAVGLVLPATRGAAGLCLALLFVCLLPANIYAALSDVPFAGGEASPLWQRVPEQILYIAVALAARGRRATPAPEAAGPVAVQR